MICWRGSINIDVKTLSPNSRLVKFTLVVCNLKLFWQGGNTLSNLQVVWKMLKQVSLTKSLKVCTNSSVSFNNSKCFIFLFPLKQLMLSQPVNACRERRVLETTGPHFSATDWTEIQQDYLLVLVATYESALNELGKEEKRPYLEYW